jgi:hypothetical protein
LGQITEGLTIVVVIVALIIALASILIPLSMILSDDIMSKIEGTLAAPLLIGAGVAIFIALIGAVLERRRR